MPFFNEIYEKTRNIPLLGLGKYIAVMPKRLLWEANTRFSAKCGVVGNNNLAVYLVNSVDECFLCDEPIFSSFTPQQQHRKFCLMLLHYATQHLDCKFAYFQFQWQSNSWSGLLTSPK